MKSEIDTDRVADRIDRERRQKVMQQARADVARRRRQPLSYAAVIVPEGIDRLVIRSNIEPAGLSK